MPKPLVEVGGMPILWHVVGIYAAQGFDRFLLATGYRGDMVAEFAAGARWPAPASVDCVDTGVDTPTGGRVARLADRLEGGTFCVTYADGLADVDLAALVAAHREGGAAATMTVVRPHLPWGVAEMTEDGRVSGFAEKPRGASWINGGFLCFEPRALARIGVESVLEREPLQDLAAAGELRAHRHEGFWDCMDTYKDAVMLDDLWRAGEAPWAVWERTEALR